MTMQHGRHRTTMQPLTVQAADQQRLQPWPLVWLNGARVVGVGEQTHGAHEGVVARFELAKALNPELDACEARARDR
jgi:erythromycin esterase-like protein